MGLVALEQYLIRFFRFFCFLLCFSCLFLFYFVVAFGEDSLFSCNCFSVMRAGFCTAYSHVVTSRVLPDPKYGVGCPGTISYTFFSFFLFSFVFFLFVFVLFCRRVRRGFIV